MAPATARCACIRLVEVIDRVRAELILLIVEPDRQLLKARLERLDREALEDHVAGGERADAARCTAADPQFSKAERVVAGGVVEDQLQPIARGPALVDRALELELGLVAGAEQIFAQTCRGDARRMATAAATSKYCSCVAAAP
jgi:hypothetical protein